MNTECKTCNGTGTKQLPANHERDFATAIPCPDCGATGSKKTREQEQAASLNETGRRAYSALVVMVAALQCDYDRLEELREERDGYDAGGFTSGPELWAAEHADDAAELAELEAAAGDCESEDDARTRIEEDALSLEVRSDWQSMGEPLEAAEFCILLTTGGPAVRIVGELDNGEPSRPRLEVQDWGTPWTHYLGEYKDGSFEVSRDVLQAYCSVFCFEQG